MPAPAKIRRAGTFTAIPLLSLLLCAAATEPSLARQAQPSPVLNGQVQLGDVVADQTLNVVSADSQVVVQATAVANVASAIGQDGDLAFNSTQKLSGAATASATGVVQGSAGALLAVESSATGDTATAGTCCGTTSGTSIQTVTPSTIAAYSAASTGQSSGQVSVDATAIGNTQGWLSANGAIDVVSVQSLSGQVSANTGANICCIAGESGYTATAVGNDVTAQATASPLTLKAMQNVDAVSVSSALKVTQSSSETVIAQSTATANNLNAAADGYAAAVTADQTNTAPVSAGADVTVGDFNQATVGAYGVGNSTILTNAGYATSLTNTQTNAGGVTATASFGGSGYASMASAAAVGNAVSVYACSTCEGGVQATNSQSNTGAVRAVGAFGGGAVYSATAAASAVGNTATYQVRSPGG